MLSVGFMYEPLVYVNPLQQGKTTPMLASSFKWSNGNKTLTFTIRSGVKWSDGTPMTANDVAYTFNLTKKNPALDLTGAWSVLSSVTASGNTVTMNFKHRGRAVLLLHRGPDADRARARLLEDVQPGHRPGQGPGRHRPVHDEQVHPAEHHLQGQPELLAAGPAEGQDDPVPGLHQQQHGQRRPGQRERAVGRPVHPWHPGVLHRPRARTTTTGSRRRSTSRWSRT